jgi:hypothetical protein
MNAKLKNIVLGEWNTIWGKKNFRVCLTATNDGNFSLFNSDGRSLNIDRSKAVAWLKSNSDVVKMHQNIDKFLPEYYN